MKTDKRLNTISFKDSDITSIIKSLKPTKAHGADNISIRMIQLCGDSITLPLTLIFKFSLRNGIFPATWKMANIIPVQKKEEKHIVKNYRPISLLPIFVKIFERLLFNSLFTHFHDNDLFTKCQSGFMPGDIMRLKLTMYMRLSVFLNISLEPQPEMSVNRIKNCRNDCKANTEGSAPGKFFCI